jgi:type IV secretory pathway ATPase VirB11/archaellum biosynthesis ATPase
MRALERELDPKTIRRGIDRTFKKDQRIRPGFSSSWVIPTPPYDAKLIKQYVVSGSRVGIYLLPNQTEDLYHVYPYEYTLPEPHMELLDLVRADLAEHYPATVQISQPEQARDYVLKYAMRTIYKLAKTHGIPLGRTRAEEIRNVKTLSEILAKYTAGMGITEIFLNDPYIQDIYIDAPSSEKNVYVTIGGIGDERLSGKCITNVILTDNDAESLLSRFRYESGRPFSEAMPLLECDLDAYNTRVTVIGSPLSPSGVAFALRRHSTDPWTLLRLINNKSLTPLAAGLISFLIDGQATILVAGSRGAGKTSLLGAIMLEFPLSQRILTIEDTLELPGPEMGKLGYKIQSMHIRSSIGGMGEMSADEALRVALRLGESAIVLGEVRGEEAKTLYEAMRAGTAGSSVLGTFHANSAKAVYERIVYDMGIPPKSFTSTDIIIIAGLTRPGGIQRQTRRVTQIAEVRKLTGEEGEFQDLMVYREDLDRLVETDAFRYGSEVIGSIAKSWGISMEEAVQNIEARARIRGIIVNYAQKYNKPELLSARWVSNANNAFWGLIEKYQAQRETAASKAKGRMGVGINYERLVDEWKAWFRRSVEYA